MRKIQVRIQHKGKVFNTIDERIWHSIGNFDEKFVRFELDGSKYVAGKKINSSCEVIIVSSSEEHILRRKSFEILLDSISVVAPELIAKSFTISAVTHNNSAIIAKIRQEIDFILPDEKLMEASNYLQLEKVGIELVRKSGNNVAKGLLRILKQVQLMECEFETFQCLENAFDLQILGHDLRKVIVRVASCYFDDFSHRNIELRFAFPSSTAFFDFSVVSTCLLHLFSNAAKYCASDSHITVYAGVRDSGEIEISLKMLSLEIDPEEITEIRKYGVRGRVARKIVRNSPGEGGVGLYIIENLMNRMSGRLEIEPNFSSNPKRYENDKTYSLNCFRIVFPNKFGMKNVPGAA